MNIQSEQQGKVEVLRATGRIDVSGANAFREALQPHLEVCVAGGTPLLLHLGGVDYISSAGLRELLIAAKKVKAGGGRMMVCALQPTVAEVVRISRFDLVLNIAESAEAALQVLQAPA